MLHCRLYLDFSSAIEDQHSVINTLSDNLLINTTLFFVNNTQQNRFKFFWNIFRIYPDLHACFYFSFVLQTHKRFNKRTYLQKDFVIFVERIPFTYEIRVIDNTVVWIESCLRLAWNRRFNILYLIYRLFCTLENSF